MLLNVQPTKVHTVLAKVLIFGSVASVVFASASVITGWSEGRRGSTRRDG